MILWRIYTTRWRMKSVSGPHTWQEPLKSAPYSAEAHINDEDKYKEVAALFNAKPERLTMM